MQAATGSAASVLAVSRRTRRRPLCRSMVPPTEWGKVRQDVPAALGLGLPVADVHRCCSADDTPGSDFRLALFLGRGPVAPVGVAAVPGVPVGVRLLRFLHRCAAKVGVGHLSVLGVIHSRGPEFDEPVPTNPPGVVPGVLGLDCVPASHVPGVLHGQPIPRPPEGVPADVACKLSRRSGPAAANLAYMLVWCGRGLTRNLAVRRHLVVSCRPRPVLAQYSSWAAEAYLRYWRSLVSG